jgi:DNA invertase Pin-like site-specific DNA recombinase
MGKAVGADGEWQVGFAWEREIMLERQREGIAKAKGEGKFKGRKRKANLMPEKIKALKLRNAGSLLLGAGPGLQRRKSDLPIASTGWQKARS